MPTFYHGSTGNSPLRPDSKRSRGDLTATQMTTNSRELLVDVQAAVEQDFTRHYRLTNTPEFLEKLLPVSRTHVDKILQKMKDQCFYDFRSRRWTHFPPSDSKCEEKSLYGPFTHAAEAIRVAAEEIRKESHADSSSTSELGPTTWVDYHTKSPRSHDALGAQIRPDSLFALRIVADHTETKESKKGQADIMKMIWWLQIIAAVEMKRSDSDEWVDLVKQLIGYLRRILCEQLDRRFVFGLTLGPEMMTVWMHDRSGVIGTKKAINIHEEPAKFVQVIAAFSLLSPEKLGFDPTIKLLVSSDQAVPSYRPTAQFITAYQAAPYNRRWVIRTNDGNEYVTVRTVSSVRAGFMRGRGSIVWVVVPYGKHSKESKFFVLKQSWRPRGVDSEGELYKVADGSRCPHVGKIDYWEDVLISGQPDTTDALIRQGLDDSTGPGKRSTVHRPDSSDPYIHVTCTESGDIMEVQARDSGSVSRVRTRVLLSTYGWVIKYFSSLRELLQVLRDAIAGHKHLYRNGVLHRDISPGNILIEWRPGSEPDKPSTSGRLIDLDHAKQGKLFRGNMKAFVDDKIIDTLQNTVLQFNDITVDKDVARLSLELSSMNACVPGPKAERLISAVVYINAAISYSSIFRGLTEEQICTPRHLGWKQVEILHNFNFDSTECQKGSRTGTPPYTSGEILSLQPYYPGHPNPVFHDAVHDIESFFWVLVHICVTRQGPGGVRRDELEENNQENEEYPNLRRVVFCFFDSDNNTMQANKQSLFQNPAHLDEYLLANFHGYFQTLKGLVKEWFHVLGLAHKFHAFEYHDIHDVVLEIFDRAMRSLPAVDIDDATRKVLSDRKADLEQLDGNPFGKVQLSPPPHISPGSQRQLSVHPSPPSSPTPAPPSKKKK